MPRRTICRAHARWIRTAFVAILACLLIYTTTWAVLYTFGCRLRVYQLTASKKIAEKPNKGTLYFDERIPDAMRSALIRKYGTKYKSYTFESEDTRMVQYNDPQEYALQAGHTLTITWQSKREKILNFKFQIDMSFDLAKVIHGQYGFMTLGDQDEPLIVVVNPWLIQDTR